MTGFRAHEHPQSARGQVLDRAWREAPRVLPANPGKPDQRGLHGHAVPPAIPLTSTFAMTGVLEGVRG